MGLEAILFCWQHITIEKFSVLDYCMHLKIGIILRKELSKNACSLLTIILEISDRLVPPAITFSQLLCWVANGCSDCADN